ncbi:MAG: hypothetical protein ACD_62C00146G0001 [uncultured bacterium]|nr:MAG: hypothetical protein ACD_62C00146G0001 [uncultured bacterium]
MSLFAGVVLQRDMMPCVPSFEIMQYRLVTDKFFTKGLGRHFDGKVISCRAQPSGDQNNIGAVAGGFKSRDHFGFIVA